MVKMFTNDEFSNYIYKKHIESVLKRFTAEERFPCFSVGKLTSSCNRKNYYTMKDMEDGIYKDFDRESIVRMTMGQILHDSFVLSEKSEWHIKYDEIYGHVDEYFPKIKVLMEKKTTIDDIPAWKQTQQQGANKFKYMPSEEWENQLRYYYLLIQKGEEVDTGKPTNPENTTMVKRVYVLYYSPNVDDLFYPYIVPVPMTGEKWNLSYIEDELLGKRDEIEHCLDTDTIPNRAMSPFRCPYCPYMMRCFSRDKSDDEDIPETIKQLLGKRSPEARIQELRL